MKQLQFQVLIAAALILMAATLRVVNAEMQWYNFAPLAALGLFAGAVLKNKKYAFLFVLLGQLLGDIYFQLFTQTPGFYGIAQFFTYGGLVAATVLGFFLKKFKPVNIVLFSLGSSTVFFLVSNFGYFVEGWNTYTMEGLIKTYVMALPFYRNAIVGDLIGSTMLFGLYSLVQRVYVARFSTQAGS